MKQHFINGVLIQMIALSVENINLSYGVDTILENISFSINEGDKLGIVGVNGAGKSSLLKIITGRLEATSGKVYTSLGKSVMMLDQNVSFNSDATLIDAVLEISSDLISREAELENIRKRLQDGDERLAGVYSEKLERFIADGGLEFRSRAKGILVSLGFNAEQLSMNVNSLSGGQKTRLSLCRILYKSPDILILDEPTNHLDMNSLRWLEDHLSNYRKTVIVVSHDRYFLDRVTNKILDIENKKGKLYSGNYTIFCDKKRKDREIQSKHYELQQKEIARIEAIIAQQVTWSQERNYKIIDNKQKMIDRMEKIDRPENLPQNVRISFPECSESGNDVLTIRGLSKAYGDKTLFRGFDYLVKRKDRVLITGDNGCGKSTLLKIITGYAYPDKGESWFGYNVKVGYYDQENQNLNPANTVLDELWNAFSDLGMTQIRNTLALFNFTGDDVFKRVSDLSGGEKARLTLAKLVTSKSNLMILDEPTNHLDINTREILETALSEYKGTIIAVSHDRYFVRKLSTRMIIFHSGDAIPESYEGNYSEYLHHIEVIEASGENNNGTNISGKEKSSAKEEYLKNKKDSAQMRKKQRRYEKCAEEIAALEGRLSDIENEISENSSDHIKLTELFSEKESSEEKLLELYEEYEELSKLFDA